MSRIKRITGEENCTDEYWRRVDEHEPEDIRLKWFRDYEKYFKIVAEEILDAEDRFKCVDSDPSKHVRKLARGIIDEYNFMKLQRNWLVVGWVMLFGIVLILHFF